MRRRILTRLLWMVPALFVVSFLVFFINACGNQHGNFMDTQSENISSGDFSQQKIKNQTPVFYFSVTSLSEPDTIWKMTDEEKELLQKNSSWKKFIPVIHFYGDNQYPVSYTHLTLPTKRIV